MNDMTIAMIQIMIEDKNTAYLIQMENHDGFPSAEVFEMDMEDNTEELIGGFSIPGPVAAMIRTMAREMVSKAVLTIAVSKEQRKQ